MTQIKNKFRSINNWLHLWLGLTSGIIVFIVSITGCIYVFQQEIQNTLEPWRFVKPQNAAFAPPSQLIDTAKTYVHAYTPTGLTYEGKDGAAAVGFWIMNEGKREFEVVFLNPYTAEFIKKEAPLAKGKFNFFRFIMNGHRALWLPYNIGRPIVGSAVLIFVVLLITGLIMWWPKKWNKNSAKLSFKVNVTSGFKRLNHDLHNVLGFYVFIFALAIAITGLTWSFHWVDNGLYYITSGGESKAEHQHPHSDVSLKNIDSTDTTAAIDRAFYLALQDQPNPARIYMSPTLRSEDESIEVILYKHKGKFYHHNEYFFDQYTLKKIKVEKYDEALFAEKVDMMKYDIHTGSIWGLPGKILVFFASLICASLPVTGFIIWIKKRSNRKKQKQSLSSHFN